MKDTVLVIPTIRENSFNDFIKRWDSVGLFDQVDLIVMEDNPKKTFQTSDVDLHLSWEDIEQDLGKDSWIIPRRSDTVRSYGYLVAARKGYDFILTLDDDCYPCTDDDGLTYDGLGFVSEHKKQLVGRTKWFNTLNSVKPRGIPFYEKGSQDRMIVNHGLWTNVLDYDAPYQLANPIKEKFSYDNVVVPNGSYFPMCGMNVMWKNEATVLMYHLLMGQRWFAGSEHQGASLVKLPFDRFGDIWCGIFMKKIADLTLHNVSTGMPYIRHERASNPFTNLKKEANGIEVNERLWKHVDSFVPACDDGYYGEHQFVSLYRQLGEHIAIYEEYPEHVEYFRRLGDAMVTWANMFRSKR